LLDENGLSDDRTNAARTQEPGKRSDDMNEKDDEIAHLSILARTATPRNCVLPAIRHRHVSPEDFSAALTKFGVPPWQVDGLVEDYAHYARGEASAVDPTVRQIAGTDPRDVFAFARDYASKFIS